MVANCAEEYRNYTTATEILMKGIPKPRWICPSSDSLPSEWKGDRINALQQKDFAK